MIRKISVFFVHLACIIYFNLKIVGKENVPKEGAYILCANHKSNWDPPRVVSSIKRKMLCISCKKRKKRFRIYKICTKSFKIWRNAYDFSRRN